MNFLNVIRHAAIGYGIRRKSWHEDRILSMGNDGTLWWLATREFGVDEECKLLGGRTRGSIALDLFTEDITATDWEAI